LPDGTDVEGRPVVNGGTQYQYDHAGKRAVTLNGDYRGGTWEFVMYDFAGRRLATVGCSYQAQTLCWMKGTNVYFGGKMLKSSLGTVVATDRLGSVRANGDGERFAYYPYGEERGSSADGREKFGTYVRDSGSWDYADQRYYGVGTGRFSGPDPSTGVDAADPASWNKYAYVLGDPINGFDPTGLDTCKLNGEEVYQPACLTLTLPGWYQPTGPIHTVAEYDDEHPKAMSSKQILSQAEKLATKWLADSDCRKLFNVSGEGPEFAPLIWPTSIF